MEQLETKQRLIWLDLLKTYFNESELREMFFALGVDYDALPGNGTADKARELILYLERRERIIELLDLCKKLRPQVDWEIQKQSQKLTGISTKNAILEKLAPFPITPIFAHAQLSDSHWTNRVDQIQKLTELWHTEHSRIAVIIGLGGVGKSSLARRWYDDLSDQNVQPDGVFWWSFYYQPSLDEFLEGALAYLTNNQFKTTDIPSPWARTQQLLTLLNAGKFLLVLDGLEVMQKVEESSGDLGRMEDKAFRNLLELCANPERHQSFILVTSRFPLTDLQTYEGKGVTSLRLDHFSQSDGALYLKNRGVIGSLDTLRRLSRDYNGHVLSLSLLAGYLNEYFASDAKYAGEIPHLAIDQTSPIGRILQVYDSKLNDNQRAFMKLLSAIRRPFTHEMLEELVNEQEYIAINPLLEALSEIGHFKLRQMLSNLEKRGLIYLEQNHLGEWCYTAHLIIREYFHTQLSLDNTLKQQVNLQLRDFSSKLSVPDPLMKLEDLASLFDMVFYSCQAGLYDEALDIYHNHMSLGHWEIGFRFGAYEFQISFLREFFPNKNLSSSPLLKKSYAKCFLFNFSFR